MRVNSTEVKSSCPLPPSTGQGGSSLRRGGPGLGLQHPVGRSVPCVLRVRQEEKFLIMAGSWVLAMVKKSWMRLNIPDLACESSWSYARLPCEWLQLLWHLKPLGWTEGYCMEWCSGVGAQGGAHADQRRESRTPTSHCSRTSTPTQSGPLHTPTPHPSSHSQDESDDGDHWWWCSVRISLMLDYLWWWVMCDCDLLYTLFKCCKRKLLFLYN